MKVVRILGVSVEVCTCNYNTPRESGQVDGGKVDGTTLYDG